LPTCVWAWPPPEYIIMPIGRWRTSYTAQRVFVAEIVERERERERELDGDGERKCPAGSDYASPNRYFFRSRQPPPQRASDFNNYYRYIDRLVAHKSDVESEFCSLQARCGVYPRHSLFFVRRVRQKRVYLIRVLKVWKSKVFLVKTLCWARDASNKSPMIDLDYKVSRFL